MKKFLLALFLLLAGGFVSTASAHHGWGWGGWGHRHYGYYGGGIGIGYGWGGGGWGGYYPYGYRGFGYGYYPRAAYYSNYYAPYYGGGYYNTYYAPAYYAPRYYAPAYYYPSCQTTYYSNVIAATVPPAEYYYGPQAVQRFLSTPPANNIASNDAANAVKLAAMIVKSLKPEINNQPDVFIPKDSLPLARSRARKTMALGDRYFGEQNYYQAVLKYREAARTAPDLAEAHFRLAHAETALGRFNESAAAYRQALAANPDITRENFHLKDLYGEDHIAKGSHLEAAAAAALQATDDTSLLLVVGMFLRYDGQEERAVKFLRKAWELGDRAPHLARYWGAEANDGKVLVADQET